MTQYGHVGALPGHVAAGLDNNRVVCTWKGYPDYSVLFFFLTPNPEENVFEYRILVQLRFDYEFSSPEQAREMARQSWGRFRDRILSGCGRRVRIAISCNDEWFYEDPFSDF